MARPLIELKGERFGKLLVERRSFRAVSGDTLWRCKCDCGAVREVQSGRLRRWEAQSCLPCAGRNERRDR